MSEKSDGQKIRVRVVMGKWIDCFVWPTKERMWEEAGQRSKDLYGDTDYAACCLQREWKWKDGLRTRKLAELHFTVDSVTHEIVAHEFTHVWTRWVEEHLQMGFELDHEKVAKVFGRMIGQFWWECGLEPKHFLGREFINA